GKNLRVSGAGKTLAINSGGSLSVTGGTVYARSLDLSSASSFSFTGGSITVDGGTLTWKTGQDFTLSAAGGSLNLTAAQFSPQATVSTTYTNSPSPGDFYQSLHGGTLYIGYTGSSPAAS